MKKLTIIFASMLLFSIAAVANSGDQVSAKVEKAFLKNFAGAQFVTWESSEDFFFASFNLEEKKVTAAYNKDGELIGISRKLLLAEIPLNVSRSIKDQFPGYSIFNSVTEMMYDGQTFYYATVETAGKILKLKCYSGGEIDIEKRIRK